MTKLHKAYKTLPLELLEELNWFGKIAFSTFVFPGCWFIITLMIILGIVGVIVIDFCIFLINITTLKQEKYLNFNWI